MRWGLSIILMFLAVRAVASTTLEYPSINFPTPVTVDNVCFTETTLQTIKPVNACVEISVVAQYACLRVNPQACRKLEPGQLPKAFELLQEETACTKSEIKILETPRDYFSRECTRWVMPPNPDQGSPECGRWADIPKKRALIYTIRIISDEGDQGYHSVGTKRYALPACQR